VRTAYKWSRKFSAKFFFEIRDIWPLSIQVMGKLSSAHPLVMFFRNFEKFGHKKADYSVTVLSNAKQHFINAGMPENRFVHIPNGIDLTEANNALPVSEEVLSRFPKDKFVVGYTGTIGTANAMNFLVEAVIRLSHNEKIHFVIVGDGDKLDELKAKAKDCSNITFIPPVPKRMVHSVIRMFDACYMGMLNDPLYCYGISPNKIFDYLYSARPVILAVNSPGNPVELAGGVVIEPENTDALVAAVEQVYAMSEEGRKQMGEKGRNYVVENHTYPALVQRYMALIG
jgi:glycosyltransferase involved in cell wall biosynthesis